MGKTHNFYAGPSILPQYTIDETAKAIKDFAGTGLSIMEISHRSKPFINVMNNAKNFKKRRNFFFSFFLYILRGKWLIPRECSDLLE